MAFALHLYDALLLSGGDAVALARAGGMGTALGPVLAGLGALLVALVLTPLVRAAARRYGWIARPSADRWHDEPVALLGGIAIFGAVGAAVVSSGALSTYGWPVWAGGTLIFAAGLADDLMDMKPETKLVVQIVATALLLYAGHAFWRGGPFWVSIPLTFLWVIGITNAFNLIDGLDGLASSLGVVAATALALIGGVIGQMGLATVGGTLAGASLGFLVYNAKPARIFMGDCGSLFLGYTLAVVALGVQSTGEPVTGTLVPVVVLAVPIFDTTFVTVTRILWGRRVTKGGNDHTHHRLVRLGLSERGAVLALSGISALFAAAALSLLWATAQLFLAVVLLGSVAAVVFGLYLVGSRSYEPTRSHAPTLSERVGALMRALAGGIYWKSVGGVVADLLVIVAAFIVAVHLRFGGAPPAGQLELLTTGLPGIVVLKVVVFYGFGLYHGVWRHAGTPEVVRLLKASTLASALTLAGLLVGYGAQVSLSAVILDWMIVTAAVGGTRFGFRALRQYFAARRDEGRRVLVYGSGDAGVLAVRHLRHRLDRTVVGLLDDDPARHALQVQGVSVLGGPDDLARIAAEHDVDEVIVPVQDTSQQTRAALVRRCQDADLACRHFALRLEPADRDTLPAPSGDGAQVVTPSSSS